VCRAQLGELQEFYSDFKEAGAEVIAISVDRKEDAEQAVKSLGLEFPVLYDTDAAVTKSWAIYNLLGDGLAAPSTFVFDATGTLRAFRIGRDAGDRPSASEVLEVIKSFSREGSASTPGQGTGGGAVGSVSTQTTTAATATPAQPAPEPALGPGLSDFTLPNANGGGPVTLSDYLGKKHIVLVFYRAYW
jgi:peroxiredoxin